MRPLTRKAVRDITGKKLRSTLALLTLGTGVMGLTAVTIAASQLDESYSWSATIAGHPSVEILSSRVTPAVISLLARHPDVTQIEARAYEPVLWHSSSGPRLLAIVGIDRISASGSRAAATTARSLATYRIERGSSPHGAQLLAEAHDGLIAAVSTGSSLTLQVGSTVHRVVVSGLTESLDRSLSRLRDGPLAYMSTHDLERLFGTPAMSDILVRLHPGADSARAAAELARALRASHVTVYDLQAGATPRSKQPLDGFLTEAGVAAGVILLLGVVLVIGNTSILLAEQRSTLAMLRAIGGTRAGITRAYLIPAGLSAGIACGLGLLAGLVAADALVRYIAQLLTLEIGPLSVNPGLLLLIPALGFAGALLGSLIMVAVRGRIGARETLVDPGLVATAAARVHRRARYQRIAAGLTAGLLPLALLSAAGAVFLAAEAGTSSFEQAAWAAASEYRADLFVNISRDEPFGASRQAVLRAPGVSAAEPYQQVQVDTEWGSASLVGLDASTRLYRPDVVDGRWLRPAERGVALISQDAATRSGLRVGSLVRLHTDMYAGSLRIVGVVRDWNSLAAGPGAAGVILTTNEQVEYLRGFGPGYTRGLLVGARTRSPAAVARLAAQVAQQLARAGTVADVTTATQRADELQSQLNVLYGLFYVVAAIIGLIGLATLADHLLLAVIARRRELGIVRVMGAQDQRIARSILRQSVRVILTAASVAVAVGVPVAAGLLDLLERGITPVPFELSFGLLATVPAYVLLLGALASVPAVWSAVHLRSGAALRYK